MGIKELPLMERPYEKFTNYGANKLSDAELLAIIIKSGTKDRTSVQIVQELMNKYDYDEKGLSFLNELSQDELQQIKGIGEIKAIQIQAIVEIAKRISRPVNLSKYKITSPSDVAKLMMEELRYLKQEHLITILLDVQNYVLKVVTNTIGGLNFSMVETRDIFREPIKMSASKIVIVHNHPSGNPYPSDSDIRLTFRVAEAGKIFGIDVIDHIIIGNGIFSSLKELNKY